MTFGNRTTGAEVWRSENGTSWGRIADAGWGNSTNMVAGYSDHAATVFGESLYVGAVNQAAGAGIWAYPLLTYAYLPFLVW